MNNYNIQSGPLHHARARQAGEDIGTRNFAPHTINGINGRANKREHCALGGSGMISTLHISGIKETRKYQLHASIPTDHRLLVKHHLLVASSPSPFCRVPIVRRVTCASSTRLTSHPVFNYIHRNQLTSSNSIDKMQSTEAAIILGISAFFFLFTSNLTNQVEGNVRRPAIERRSDAFGFVDEDHN